MKKQFITEAKRMQKLAGIVSESNINENQLNPLDPNSRHPDLLNFVKANLANLISVVNPDPNNEKGWNFDDLDNIIISDDNFYDIYTDRFDLEPIPNGQDIYLVTPESERNGVAVEIKNHPTNYDSDTLTRPIPGFKGLYYDVYDF